MSDMNAKGNNEVKYVSSTTAPGNTHLGLAILGVFLMKDGVSIKSFKIVQVAKSPCVSLTMIIARRLMST